MSFTRIKMTTADQETLKKNLGALKTQLEVARVVGSVNFYKQHPNYEPPKRPAGPEKK